MSKEKLQVVVDYFEIDNDLAKELSDLLTKQVIRERLLLQLVNDPGKYEEVEKLLIPITSKIEAIKVKITRDFVPEKYRSQTYMWNYTGYEIDGNEVEVIEEK